jgi:starvation-inducible DNA-binding protein
MASTTKTGETSKAKTDSTVKRSKRRISGGVGLTDEQNAESGFAASATLTENLQRVLVDVIALAMQGKQAHWNVVGKNFRDTHLQLDEVIAAARLFSDTVAERMRALHAVPDGRSETVSETTSLPPMPAGELATTDVIDLVTERIEAVTATCRDVHDAVDEEDPTSADILHEILETLEKFAWMVSAENRVPAKG